MKMKYLNSTVEKVLREDNRARNNDAWLVYRVWQEFEGAEGRDLDLYIFELLKSYFPDSITRIRRDFSKRGLYPADEEVQKHRRKEEIVMTHKMRMPDWSYPIWTDKLGRELPVGLISDPHLDNILKYLSSLGYSNDEEKKVLLAWKEIMEAEFKKRKNSSTKENELV